MLGSIVKQAFDIGKKGRSEVVGGRNQLELLRSRRLHAVITALPPCRQIDEFCAARVASGRDRVEAIFAQGLPNVFLWDAHSMSPERATLRRSAVCMVLTIAFFVGSARPVEAVKFSFASGRMI